MCIACHRNFVTASVVTGLNKPASRKRKLQKSAVRLLTVYDDCCRLVKPADFRLSPTSYINPRCAAVLGSTGAEALKMSFPDRTGSLQPYRRRDLDYGIKGKRSAIQFEGHRELFFRLIPAD